MIVRITTAHTSAHSPLLLFAFTDAVCVSLFFPLSLSSLFLFLSPSPFRYTGCVLQRGTDKLLSANGHSLNFRLSYRTFFGFDPFTNAGAVMKEQQMQKIPVDGGMMRAPPTAAIGSVGSSASGSAPIAASAPASASAAGGFDLNNAPSVFDGAKLPFDGKVPVTTGGVPVNSTFPAEQLVNEDTFDCGTNGFLDSEREGE